MTRLLLGFSVTVFLGSVGAFFVFVPPLLIGTVALLLMGFMLMFVLGVQVGTQSMLPSEAVVGKPLSQQAEIRPGAL